MTLYSFPWVPILANSPMKSGTVPDPELIMQSVFNVEGVSAPHIPIETFLPGISINTFRPIGGVVKKFRISDYPHFAVYQEVTMCELVIDDSEWGQILDGYNDSKEWEKLTTVIVVADTFHFLNYLRGFTRFHTPIALIGSSMKELSNAADGSIKICPLRHRPMSHNMQLRYKVALSKEDFQWIIDNHLSLYQILHKTETIQPISVALRSLVTDDEPVTALTIFWTALECLTKSPSSGTRQALAKRIAMIITENHGGDPHSVAKAVKKLWQKRNDAVHGNKNMISLNTLKIHDNEIGISETEEMEIQHLLDTIEIFRKIMSICIERGSFFDETELENLQKRYDE